MQINLVNYRFELPSTIHIYLVFHVSLLELYKESQIPSRIRLPPPPIEIYDNMEYKVEEILKVGNNNLLYLIIIWENRSFLKKSFLFLQSYYILKYYMSELTPKVLRGQILAFAVLGMLL
jgi:hypothetical protein